MFISFFYPFLCFDCIFHFICFALVINKCRSARHAEVPQTSELPSWPLANFTSSTHSNYTFFQRLLAQLPSAPNDPFIPDRIIDTNSGPQPIPSKMLTSGLTNTPLTKSLIIYIIASSIALSIFDIKHLASIHISPHIWPYAQFWRTLVWQVAGFANSTEALFTAMLVYHLRVVERAWGKRKMAVRQHLSFYSLRYIT